MLEPLLALTSWLRYSLCVLFRIAIMKIELMYANHLEHPALGLLLLIESAHYISPSTALFGFNVILLFFPFTDEQDELVRAQNVTTCEAAG